MPTYSYCYVDQPGVEFDLTHSFAVLPLATHPENGRALRRVFTPVGMTLKLGSARSGMSDTNLASKGFQKYKRQRDGSYARTVGSQGPAHIHRQP